MSLKFIIDNQTDGFWDHKLFGISGNLILYPPIFVGGTQSSRLNWETRFGIINGIARGLEYIQEESRVKIVHRDLKPANILLDRDMVPKISDFGLARICRKNEDEALTTASPGT